MKKQEADLSISTASLPFMGAITVQKGKWIKGRNFILAYRIRQQANENKKYI
jgi:hypothetical protein